MSDEAQSRTFEGQSFEIWRLDDNGNEFLVVAYDTRPEAEQRVAELAAGGHKQTYWIRESQPHHRRPAA